jgi:hypothetical protein
MLLSVRVRELSMSALEGGVSMINCEHLLTLEKAGRDTEGPTQIILQALYIQPYKVGH